MPPCQACAEAKAKQKNISKDSAHEPTTVSNGRLFLDLSSVKDAKDERIKLIDRNWRMIVDERTNSFLLKEGWLSQHVNFSRN